MTGGEEVPRFDRLPHVEAAVRTTCWLIAYLDRRPDAARLLSEYGILVAAGSGTYAALLCSVTGARSPWDGVDPLEVTGD